MKNVVIGSKQVGDGQPCFVIAEAGSNHDGRLEQAKALIDIAADASADAVKFQVFRAGRLYPKAAGVSDYLGSPRPIYEIIAEMEMPYEWIPQLTDHCQSKGILFLSSVFDEQSVDILDPYVPAFKIASYEMTHVPLVKYVAARGKPVIISTGTANLAEVRATVEGFLQTGNDQLSLMQCTARYPAPLGALHVRVVETLKRMFTLPVGLSDHSRDCLIGPLAAVAIGANLIEKHFTLSNRLPGPDHRFALEPHELKSMVDGIRKVEQALGSREKHRLPEEAELYAFARRSIFAIRNIAAGEILTNENIAVLRCGKLAPGLPPSQYGVLLGRRASKLIQAETAVQPDDTQIC